MAARPRKLARVVMILFPLLVLLALELTFRATGSFEDRIWDSPYVRFAEGHRFFPEWDDTVTMPKPTGRVRIFALGGSTTQGCGADNPFPARLERLLWTRDPGRSFEVVNGGFLAMGSHRVYQVMREAAAYEPDIYVVYLGHNEFLEDVAVDPASLEQRPGGLVRTLRGLRVVNAVRRLLGVGPSGTGDLLADQFFEEPEYPLIRSPEQYETRLAFLRYNVGRMIDFARAHDAEIIFAPAVPNLLVWPGSSRHGPGSKADPAGWKEEFEKAKWSFYADRFEDAIREFRALIEKDEGFAHNHFFLGMACLALGDLEGGRAALRQSNLLSLRGARSNTDIARVILETCSEEGVPAIDLREAFERTLVNDFQRFRQEKPLRLFLDRCHPTDEGHALIAEAFAERILSR